MADNTPDNSTDWIDFGVYCSRQAVRSTFKSFPEVERVIERGTLEEVFSSKLDIRWRDKYGHEYFGVPFGCGSAFGFTSPYHYDQSANALKPWNRSGLVGSGPVLYRPQVRERVRPVNDNQTINVALRPTAREASDTARVDISVAASEAADSVGVEKIIQSDAVLAANESADTGRVEVRADTLTTDPVPKSDDKSDKVDLSEIKTEVNRRDGADTKPNNFDKPTTPRRWPWEEQPDDHPVKPTSDIARCRKDLKRLFQLDDVLDFEVHDIHRKLVDKGCTYSPTTVSRALRRKKY